MRIVQVYYEPLRAGLFRHVVQITTGLRARGHDVSVICPPADTEAFASAVDGQEGVYSCPMRPFLNLAGTLRLVKVLRAVRPDAVHIHGQHAGLWGRVAARLAAAPAVIYTPHTLSVRRRLLAPGYRQVERALSRWTDVVISVSTDGSGELRHLGIVPRQAIVTVLNGIEPELSHVGRNEARQLLRLPQDALVVAQVGRLTTQKGPDVLLEAFARVAAGRPDAVLLLMGDGPLRPSLERRAAGLGIASRICFAGQRADARHLLSAADVCVLSSRWEGLPYAALEAMVTGLSLVVTAVGGNEELVTDGVNGLVVPPNSPEALSSALLNILGDPIARAAMGASGRQRAIVDFAVEQMVVGTEAAYALAVGGGA